MPFRTRNVRSRSDVESLPMTAFERWYWRQWWLYLPAGVFLLWETLVSKHQAANAVVTVPLGCIFLLTGLALLVNLMRERKTAKRPRVAEWRRPWL